MIARLRNALRAFGLARGLIAAFGLLMCVIAVAHPELALARLVSQSFSRIGMNAILVLAMLPAIRCGTGPNFGLPVGILPGLLGCTLALQFDLTGAGGFALAVVLGIVIAIPCGLLFGLLLNAVRGREMMVGMYTGLSITAYGCIFWSFAPFTHPRLIWPVGGKGLRLTLQLDDAFDKVLDKAWAFELFGVSVPTGLLIAVALVCLAVWLLFRTRIGLAVTAAGSNPEFARASGILPRRTRLFGTTLSTVLGAVGIAVFSQSFGFAQLYRAPQYMALPAVAAILLGGATLRRASLAHVILGVTLFQSIITMTPDISNAVIGGDMSETIRIFIQNGMILYALTRTERGR